MDFGNWLKDVGRDIKRLFKGKNGKHKDVEKKRVFGVGLHEAASRDPSCEVVSRNIALKLQCKLAHPPRSRSGRKLCGG